MSSLALGSDLTTFGLNLNSTDCLYSSFRYVTYSLTLDILFQSIISSNNIFNMYFLLSFLFSSSPFLEQPPTQEQPLFTTPPCYLMHPPTLKGEHLGKFQLETLFYMFYAMPRDMLQAYAAQELYRREWRYHPELRIWMKTRSPQDLMQSHPGIQFVYFDVNGWEARLFTTVRGNVSAGLLSDDDVRVKLPTPASNVGSGGV